MSPRNVTLISYAWVAVVLATVGYLHLAASFVTMLFACFALQKLNFGNRKWLSILLFLILLAAAFCGLVIFLRGAMVDLPRIVADSVRSIVQYAKERGVDLPFDENTDNLKELVVEAVRSNLDYLRNFAKIATKEFVFQVVAVVVAIGIFLNPEPDGKAGERTGKRSLRMVLNDAIAARFLSLFQSFERVMGAQLLISAINTVLTSVFVMSCSLRYAGQVIVLTFLCGLLPIIGNIISNAIIVGLAFWDSPKLAFFALIFLVLIHKLEYFLNSKIIGHRIRHPMWIMLPALIVGERLMGIPGIILAPVVLSFVKVELTRYEIEADGSVVEAGFQE